MSTHSIVLVLELVLVLDAVAAKTDWDLRKAQSRVPRGRVLYLDPEVEDEDEFEDEDDCGERELCARTRLHSEVLLP